MPTVDLPDVTIAYDLYESSDNRPDADVIVLICGCGGPAAGWFGIVPALVEAGYRVVTFDNRGMAPSSSPPAPYAVADLVADTLGLCDHLGVQTATFVGHSMGGWVAETLAIQHPDRVDAAAFLGSCNVATAWEKAITTVERDLASLDYDLPPLFFATETLRYLPNSELQQDTIVDSWLTLIGDLQAWPNPGRLGQYEACLAWSLRAAHAEEWQSIHVPCLVLAFEHDIDSPPQRACEAAAIIPGARYAEIPGASHLGPFTHPVPVVDVLIDFLTTALAARGHDRAT
jgi:thioesterase CepJ